MKFAILTLMSLGLGSLNIAAARAGDNGGGVRGTSVASEGKAPFLEEQDPKIRKLFGGEDMMLGNPWYHEVLSETAAEAFGFDTEAAHRIAWNADITDSYAYNPFYWFDPLTSFGLEAAVHRFKAAKSIGPDLVKVHNDDLFTTMQVVHTQYRYMTGCLVGLHWAAQIYEGTHSENADALGAAHNILGVTFHAIQDFYSHSNWIDDAARRDSIFLDHSHDELSSMYLYTGAYEEDGGIKSHGKYSILCSLVAGELGATISTVLDAYCSISLFDDTDVCIEYRDCDETGNAHVPGATVNGVTLPDNVVYYAPPGINLDNSWQAEIGVQERGIDLTGAEAFDLAKTMAKTASMKMLGIAESFMTAEGHSDFWNMVKTTISAEEKEDSFEKFNHFPFQFLSAGEYPVASEDDDGYYLRVVLKTSSASNSGTDADILLIADGQTFNLDYMPGASAMVAYNDFEAGDETVYTVGPFDTLPSQITLKNNAPDFGDILSSLGTAIANAFISFGEAVADAFTNTQDYIGTNSFTLEPSVLQAIPVGGFTTKTVSINGGDAEGAYQIRFTIYRIASGSEQTDKYKVRLSWFKCTDESNEASWSDEPFMFTGVYAYGRTTTKNFHYSGVKTDTDKGETKYINYDFPVITFEKPLGAIVVTMQMWESDNEGYDRRMEIYNDFKGQEDAGESTGFFENVGAAIAADWKLDWINVYAFQRGQSSVQAGPVLFDGTDRWIEGGHSHTWTLDASGMTQLSTLSDHFSSEAGAYCVEDSDCNSGTCVNGRCPDETATHWDALTEVSSGQYGYTVNHHISGLCADGSEAATTYTGVTCGDHQIVWNSMATAGGLAGKTCAWDRSGKSDTWQDEWIGQCGVAPTNLPGLPRRVPFLHSDGQTVEFVMDNTEHAFCMRGEEGQTHFYGTRCGDNNDQILWNSMVTPNPQTGEDYTCSWNRSGKAQAWIDKYVGECGVSPTIFPLPTVFPDNLA